MINESMFKHINAPVLIVIAELFISVPRSQGYTNPIEGGSTETVTNSWIVPSGDLYVGQMTPNNTLIIKNSLVQNTHGFIGSYAGSHSNSVSVVRTFGQSGANWHNTEALYIGGHRDGTSWVDGGTGNTLALTGRNSWVFVGEMDAKVQYNLSKSIIVGDASGTPEMVIANGSSVWSSSSDCYIGYGTNESGSVEIRGEGSVWEAGFVGGSDYQLYVGRSGSGNKLTISDGGLLDADGTHIGYMESADNNMVLVTGKGSRWVGFFFDVGSSGSGNRLEISDGGVVDSAIGGTLGFWDGSDNNSALVTGTGSAWEADGYGGEIVVGWHGNGNTLTVNDGGEIRAGGGIISVGRDSGSDNNAVFVSGNGSAVSSALFYLGGEWNVGGRGNGLYVADGGLVSVGDNMFSRNYSTVSIDGPSSRIVIGENYSQDGTSILQLGITSNTASALMQVGGTAEFEAGATVQYQSDIMLPDFETGFTNLLVEADQLIVAGVTNSHDMDLEVVKLDSSLVEMELWGLDHNMYGLFTRRHLAESAGFAPGSQLARVSGEIDALSVQGNALAVNQINLLNGMSASQQNAQLTQRYAQGSPNYQHNRTLIGGRDQVLSQSRRFQSSARADEAEASGPAGPTDEERELRGWIRGYGSWADDDGSSSFSGYDHNVYGTIVGLDKAYGNVLLGAGGGYARSDLTQDNNDSSNAKTGYGMLYASMAREDWFGDLWAGYGQSRVETSSGTLLGGFADFTADNVAFYLGGGRVIRPSGMADVTFIPEVALMADYYDQPDYTDGLMKVEAYDRWSYQSRLGAALNLERNLGSFVIKPEVRAYWLHEFNAEPDRVGYSLTGGSDRYYFGVQAPVEDSLEAGLGLGIAFSDQLELVLDVDSRYSGQYKAVTAAGSIKYEF